MSSILLVHPFENVFFVDRLSWTTSTLSLTGSGWTLTPGDTYFLNERIFIFQFPRVQIAIGPYEVKEDSFAGLKAAFEAFVYVSDQKFEFASNKLRSLLPESEVHILKLKP